jgi:dTDP-4-amino-4,6-dideoxygalactose transaminase
MECFSKINREVLILQTNLLTIRTIQLNFINDIIYLSRENPENTMKKIQMVDLLAQFRKIEPEVMQAIKNVIQNTAFIKGPDVKEFADKLEKHLAVNHAIPCGNGTDALQVALMALDLQPGDEVITTPFTFIATIEVIKLLGLKPVLIDIEEGSFNIDVSHIENAISDRTKVILPVHLFGQCCDMKTIMDIAARKELFVVEDTAQALGANYYFEKNSSQKAGTIGHIGCTSFFPSKNLGTFGDGGAIFTNDVNLGEKLAAMVNHGMKKRYYYDYIGVNSRLDTIQAAILNIKINHLEEYNNSRRKAADFYDEHLASIEEIKTPPRSENSDHIFHQYTIRVKNNKRNDLKKYLNEHEIPAMIYYPVGLHLQEAYKDLGYKQGDFPVTEKACEEVLSLPMHTELTKDQLDYICEIINDFFKK